MTGETNVSTASSAQTLPQLEGNECVIESTRIPVYPDWLPSVDGAMRSGSETILLVEDEAFVREVAVEVLRSAGYGVLIAKNAAEARDLYDEFTSAVALLLSDVILPDENGWTLARRLRSQDKQLPVLLVTGYAEQANMKSELAGIECLAKPFSAGALLEKVQAMLDKRTLERRMVPVTHAYGIELPAKSPQECGKAAQLF